MAAATSSSPPTSSTCRRPLWVTGEDNLLVRYLWREFDLEYVLTSLETDSQE